MPLSDISEMIFYSKAHGLMIQEYFYLDSISFENAFSDIA